MNAPDLVILLAPQGPSQHWNTLGRALAPHYKAALYEGAGRSGEDVVARLLELLAQVNAARAHLVASASAASAALAFLAAQPAQVRSLSFVFAPGEAAEPVSVPVPAVFDLPVLLAVPRVDGTPRPPPGLAEALRAAAPAAWVAGLAEDADPRLAVVLESFLRSVRSDGEDSLVPPPEAPVTLPAGTTAEHLLRMLALRGVELFASNSGTDFTPIIDGLARLEEEGVALPRVVQAPHENTAIALAHGHALLSRRPQVAMGHVHVGTANMGLGLINAARARVPLMLMAGRTPWYEEGKDGVRTNFVQWGQESYDQGGSFREFTKWDYELRSGHALDTVVDRALALTQSEPAGPVYLMLPKEPLCEKVAERPVARAPRQTPTRRARPETSALEVARAWISRARRPLIVTADLGRHSGGPEALVKLSLALGAGVVEHGKRNFFNFPTEHPHHLGFEPLPHVAEADLILAVECPVPWIPAHAKLAKVPPVIQIGVDPLFGDLPLRGFPADLSLAGDPVETLRALAEGMRVGNLAPREAIAREHARMFGAAREAAQQDAAKAAITKRYLSYALGQAMDDDVVVFNEYNLDPWQVPRHHPDSWFENSVASGLGWALGASLGGKLAAPERTVVATVGDGAYLFNTPLSAHYVASAEGLPVVFVVFNDSAWTTIKKSTRGSHPQGHAARRDRFPLCDFSQSIDYAKVAEACGGIGLRVETPAELPQVLRESLDKVRRGDRHVLLDVRCERDG